jgi:hypothetical protein
VRAFARLAKGFFARPRYESELIEFALRYSGLGMQKMRRISEMKINS